jgi:hypothetical protein
VPRGQYDRAAARARREASASNQAIEGDEITSFNIHPTEIAVSFDSLIPESREQRIARLRKELAELDPPPPADEPLLYIGTHPLDSAPVNSKLVGTDQGTVFATPEGARILPKSDPAGMLPVGARIIKTAEGKFTASQLSPSIDCSPLTGSSTMEVVNKFVPHFHMGEGALPVRDMEQPVAIDGYLNHREGDRSGNFE